MNSGTCFNSSPSLPTHLPNFFQPLPFRFCHALCSSDVFHSFVPQSLQTHFTNFFLHGLLPPLFLAGGLWRRPQPHCSCSPYSSQAPPQPPHACSGSRNTNSSHA